MTAEIKLTQKMTQGIALTPQMRQSIHILQLPLLDLKAYLEQQVEENPVLEYAEGSELKGPGLDEEVDRPIVLSNENYRKDSEDYFNTGYSQKEMKEKQNYWESLIVKQPTLCEHLLRQLRLQSLEEIDYKIGEFIIGNIDENGYFQSSIDEVVETLKVTAQEAERVLSLIQTFEPQGVGAKNLKECLLLQLKSQGKQNSLAYQIVEAHLVDVAKNKTELIAKRVKVPLELVKKALKEISALESKPGRSVGEVENRRILPDVIVEKIDDNYEIIANGQELPSLKIRSQYKNLLNQKDMPQEVKKYLKEKLGSALWLVKAVNQRQETIRRVTECIVQTQKKFFEEGRGHLKPLTMKQVAEMVGRDESTISRVVNNKYIQTPYGIFELRYFFSGSFETDKEVVSTDTVKTQITTLIESEDRQHPLNDAKIVNILRTQGIDIARRTVTKYREKLKILPSHLRKR